MAKSLEDICKPLARFLEPPETGKSHAKTHQQCGTQRKPIGLNAYYQNLATFSDDEDQWIELQPELIVFGECRYWVEYGRDEHKHSGKNACNLPNVAHINSQRRQKPGNTQGAKD